MGGFGNKIAWLKAEANLIDQQHPLPI